MTPPDDINGPDVTVIGTGSDIFCQQERIGEMNIRTTN